MVRCAGGRDASHHGAAGHLQPAGAHSRGALSPRAGRQAAAGPRRCCPADRPPGGRPAPQHLPGCHAGTAPRRPAPCRGPRTCTRIGRGGTQQQASILLRTLQSGCCSRSSRLPCKTSARSWRSGMSCPSHTLLHGSGSHACLLRTSQGPLIPVAGKMPSAHIGQPGHQTHSSRGAPSCVAVQALCADSCGTVSSVLLQASIGMLMGSRSDTDHDLARRAALALQLHTGAPSPIASKQLPSQRRCSSLH